MSRATRLLQLRSVLLPAHLLVAIVLAACADVSPTATVEDPAFAPGGGGPPIRVTATDPAEAEQGTTLVVRVLGSNFEPGAVAEFSLDGVPPGKVRTNSTTFVSSEELRADVTIDADADLGLYDVAVTTLGGKKGVGTELFKISARGEAVAYQITDWEGAIWSSGSIDAGIGDGGAFSFDAGGRSKTAPPELCVDLSHVAGAGIVDPVTYALFVQLVEADPTSNGMSAVCSEVAVHTRDHSNIDAPQPLGEIEHAGGKIVLKDYDTSKGNNTGDWEWRLIWDVEGLYRDDPERGKGICIHHADSTVWHVYNDDDLEVDPPAGCTARGEAIDNIMRLTRYGGTSQILVAEFRVAFRFSFVPR